LAQLSGDAAALPDVVDVNAPVAAVTTGGENINSNLANAEAARNAENALKALQNNLNKGLVGNKEQQEKTAGELASLIKEKTTEGNKNSAIAQALSVANAQLMFGVVALKTPTQTLVEPLAVAKSNLEIAIGVVGNLANLNRIKKSVLKRALLKTDTAKLTQSEREELVAIGKYYGIALANEQEPDFNGIRLAVIAKLSEQPVSPKSDFNSIFSSIDILVAITSFFGFVVGLLGLSGVALFPLQISGFVTLTSLSLLPFILMLANYARMRAEQEEAAKATKGLEVATRTDFVDPDLEKIAKRENMIERTMNNLFGTRANPNPRVFADTDLVSKVPSQIGVVKKPFISFVPGRDFAWRMANAAVDINKAIGNIALLILGINREEVLNNKKMSNRIILIAQSDLAPEARQQSYEPTMQWLNTIINANKNKIGLNLIGVAPIIQQEGNRELLLVEKNGEVSLVARQPLNRNNKADKFIGVVTVDSFNIELYLNNIAGASIINFKRSDGKALESDEEIARCIEAINNELSKDGSPLAAELAKELRDMAPAGAAEPVIVPAAILTNIPGIRSSKIGKTVLISSVYGKFANDVDVLLDQFPSLVIGFKDFVSALFPHMATKEAMADAASFNKKEGAYMSSAPGVYVKVGADKNLADFVKNLPNGVGVIVTGEISELLGLANKLEKARNANLGVKFIAEITLTADQNQNRLAKLFDGVVVNVPKTGDYKVALENIVNAFRSKDPNTVVIIKAAKEQLDPKIASRVFTSDDISVVSGDAEVSLEKRVIIVDEKAIQAGKVTFDTKQFGAGLSLIGLLKEIILRVGIADDFSFGYNVAKGINPELNLSQKDYIILINALLSYYNQKNTSGKLSLSQFPDSVRTILKSKSMLKPFVEKMERQYVVNAVYESPEAGAAISEVNAKMAGFLKAVCEINETEILSKEDSTLIPSRPYLQVRLIARVTDNPMVQAILANKNVSLKDIIKDSMLKSNQQAIVLNAIQQGSSDEVLNALEKIGLTAEINIMKDKLNHNGVLETGEYNATVLNDPMSIARMLKLWPLYEQRTNKIGKASKDSMAINTKLMKSMLAAG